MTDVPGDSSTTSTISVGSTVGGNIEVGADHDWYAVTLQAGTTYTFTMNGSGASPLEDPYLRLRDASGNLLAENDDGGGTRDSRLVFTATSSGTYFLDAAAWDDDAGSYKYTGTYTLGASIFTPPPAGTIDQFADQLVNGYWGGSSHHFAVTQGGSISVDISTLSSTEQALATAALRSWSDVIGVSFNQVVGGAQITFQDTDDGAYTTADWTNGITSSATVNISTQWVQDYGSTLNSYSFQTYIHEIGHALGLGHAGDYNGDATYPNDALYSNDAWPMSVMSYFSRSENQTYGSSGGYDVTPMVADVVAMERLYGLSTSTRTGDTTYGFHSNAGNPVFDASQYGNVTVCIVDSGGTDTLDYSLATAAQTINLNADQFSSVNGRSDNLIIGRGVTIENALGGSGNDTIIGNAANNVLSGGSNPAGGGDIVSYETATAGVHVNMGLTTQQATIGAGNDTLSGFETLIGSGFNDLLTAAVGVHVQAGAGDDTLMLSTAAGSQWVDGGSGHDTLDLSNFNHGITAALYSSSFDLGGGVTVGASSIEGLVGTSYADNLTAYNVGDTLYGGGGNDVLTASQASTLSGGAGDDTYIIGAGAIISENAGEGVDSVQTGATYTLSDNVENLTLLNPTNDPYGGASVNPTAGVQTNPDGYGNALANLITGNSGSNHLYGLGGNDVLTGGAGTDVLAGGDGVDTFRDTAAGLNGDTITDLAVGEKIVITDASLSSFSFSFSSVGTQPTLTYTGGSVHFDTRPAGHFAATAGANGVGVVLTLLAGDQQQFGAISGDFNGDHRDDVLWRNDSGALTNWLGTANGSLVGNDGNASVFVSKDWAVAGTGDFNGDGRSDILWRNADGHVTDWLGTSGGGFVGNDANASVAVSNDWTVAGTGDFNGDGRADILWRQDGGALTEWLGTANGGFVGNAANASVFVSNDWQIAGIGDFNGDDHADILWRNSSGKVTDWLGLANGGFVGNDANQSAVVSADWKIVGIGDFNGDHHDDVLWRQDGGTVTEWIGTATGALAGNDGNAQVLVSNDWSVTGIGDYNGDHRDDILWRNADGTVTDWLGLSNGGFVGNSGNESVLVSNDWQVQPHHYF